MAKCLLSAEDRLQEEEVEGFRRLPCPTQLLSRRNDRTSHLKCRGSMISMKSSTRRLELRRKTGLWAPSSIGMSQHVSLHDRDYHRKLHDRAHRRHYLSIALLRLLRDRLGFSYQA